MATNRVLVLAPHTDDGELGCGGTIAKWCDAGNDVFYVAFSTAEQSVPEGFPKDILKTEVRLATEVLGIKNENLIIMNYEVRKLNYSRQSILEDLVSIKRDVKPDTVFIPCMDDIHQDHSTVAHEALRAFKSTTMLSYELIWNNISFNTHSFVVLDEEHIIRKARALKQYASQGGRPYMSEEFVLAMATTRGVQIGVKYAEAFEVVRWIQK